MTTYDAVAEVIWIQSEKFWFWKGGRKEGGSSAGRPFKKSGIRRCRFDKKGTV